MGHAAAANGLLDFLDRVSDAPEVLWLAGLAMMRRAVEEAEESRHGRLRVHPRGELRRFRQDAAPAMRLLRMAVALEEADQERDRELYAELQRAAAEAGMRRRRAQTLPAARARFARPTNFHLEPGYPAHGLLAAERGGDAGERDEQPL